MSKVVVQILRAPIGGIRKHVFDILESLSNRDIQQVFITNVKDSDKELPNYKNLKIIHAEIKDQPSIKDLKNIFYIYSQIKHLNVDIIHGHGAKGGIYARAISILIGAKCIYTPHGGSLHRAYGKIKNKIYDLIELSLIPLTNIFLFESNHSAIEYKNNICSPGNKSIVNYNGVEIPQITKNTYYQTGTEIKIASFGLLRNLKGHDIAIETCSLLHKANIPFSFTIYGQGEEKNSLTSLIEKHGLSKNILIKDYSVNVLEEMLKYDFIFHPSRFESFGYVPAEAMSLKIPVLVSNVGGLKEVVTNDSGYISETNTPESYFIIYKKIYEGDLELPLKIEAAFIRVRDLFSKEAMIKKIHQIYFDS